MTLDFFTAQMDRLSGLKFKPLNLVTHWEALQDVPDDVLEAAVTRAQKARDDFPTPLELRTDADAVAHYVAVLEPPEDRAVALEVPFTVTVPEVGTVVSIQREWKYYCEGCSDSGWESVWCGERTVPMKDAPPREIAKPWQVSIRCERRSEHGAHEWVRRCACWETNPALVRKRAAIQKYAASAGKTK